MDLTTNNMFGFFKKKSKKEKLQDLYNKKKEQAFKLSRTNRKESDKLEKEANDACGGSDDDKRSEKDKLLCSVDVLW